MYLKLSFLSLCLFFSACSDIDSNSKNYDAKKLLQEKCSSCHNLAMPPVTSEDEAAPPMMAVAFHVYDFVKPSDESQRIYRAKEFVIDYVHDPSAEKSFCDKESLKRYGVMPSQKDKVTKDELKAIAEYMFEHYTPKNLAQEQAIQAKLDAMPQGEKLAIKYNCLSCHKKEKDLVGPSFANIAKKYAKAPQEIINSIKNGSQNRWENARGVMMPKFKNLSDEEMQTLAKWILKPNS